MVLNPEELDGEGIARSLNDFRGYFDALNSQALPEMPGGDETPEADSEFDVEPMDVEDSPLDFGESLLLADEPEEAEVDLPDAIAPPGDPLDARGGATVMSPHAVGEYVRSVTAPLLRAIDQLSSAARRPAPTDTRLEKLVADLNAARVKDQDQIASLSQTIRRTAETLNKTIQATKGIAGGKQGRTSDTSLKEAVSGVIEYLGQQRSVEPPPMVSGDFGARSTLSAIDQELSRTRPGHVSGDGVTIINDGSNIGIVVDDLDQAEEGLMEEPDALYMITASEAVAGTPTTQWLYTGEKITGKTTTGYLATWTTSGVEVTLYNAAENINDQAGRQGNGIDVDGALFADNTFAFYPIQTGTPVLVREVTAGSGSTATTEYWIMGAGMPNGVDGTCA